MNHNTNPDTRHTAIIGMGALGLLYGGQIASALGADTVEFIADSQRVNRYRHMQFTINGTPRAFTVTDSREAVPADYVIVAVKYTALPQALDTMKGCIGPDTTIISVMNGITSEAIIGDRFGEDHVLYAIAQGMDAVKFDAALTYTKQGELRIGLKHPSQQSRLEGLMKHLSRCGIAYTAEDDILRRLWGKFMMNVGVNQTCMAYETTYSGVMVPGEIYDTMTGAMREVIALSQLEGINLNEQDLEEYIALLKTLSPDGMPSMRQDGICRRPSEVEMFSGAVISMAHSHGLPVPVNQRLYDKIKSIEERL